jgi:hypothetical protein
MTFDEIFQQYVAQGFTKPTAGVAGIESLMPTTATVAPIVPVQQPQDTGGGRDDDFTNVPDTTTNLGITSFSDAIQQMQDLYSQIPTPMNLAIKAIENFQNPYTGIMGNLNTATQAAIARENLRDLQDRMGRGEVDFSGGISAAQDAARGGYASGRGGDHDGGASAGAQGDAAAGMGGY